MESSLRRISKPTTFGSAISDCLYCSPALALLPAGHQVAQHDDLRLDGGLQARLNVRRKERRMVGRQRDAAGFGLLELRRDPQCPARNRTKAPRPRRRQEKSSETISGRYLLDLPAPSAWLNARLRRSANFGSLYTRPSDSVTCTNGGFGSVRRLGFRLGNTLDCCQQTFSAPPA